MGKIASQTFREKRVYNSKVVYFVVLQPSVDLLGIWEPKSLAHDYCLDLKLCICKICGSLNSEVSSKIHNAHLKPSVGTLS